MDNRSCKSPSIIPILFTALLLVCAACVLAGCMSTSGTNESRNQESEMNVGYRTITAQEAKQIMDSDAAAVVVDVRTQAEYDGGHIAGAILLPLDRIATDSLTQLPNKEQTVLIYCRSGNRSAQAASQLASMGYTNIIDFGGVNTWPYGLTTD